MKHYRILCILLILCLLTGCKATPTPTPMPSYDAAPEKSEQSIVVQGVKLRLYNAADVAYINLNELAKAKGGYVNTAQDTAAPYDCSFSLQDRLYKLSTDSENLSAEGSNIPLGGKPIFDSKDWYLPYETWIRTQSYHVYEDAEQKTTYYTAYPTQLPEGIRLPILMYHALGEEPWGISDLFVRPTAFEDQLIYLRDNGYTTVTFEDLARLHEIEKPVMLTFDDGYDDNYTKLYPLLKKYNAKATVFVITDKIGDPHYLTQAQIKEMNDSGRVSIQSHTVTHPQLDQLTETELHRELSQSKQTLARITGKEPFVLCYPIGKHSALSRKITATYYAYGLLMNGGAFTTGSDPYRIPRFYVARHTSLSSFKAFLQ